MPKLGWKKTRSMTDLWEESITRTSQDRWETSVQAGREGFEALDERADHIKEAGEDKVEFFL